VSSYNPHGDPQGLLTEYGINILPGSSPELVSRVYQSLKGIPPQVVKDCGIETLGFQDMGPSKEYYPNHGLYVDNKLILNSQHVDDPTVYVDASTGKRLQAFDHILYHELGHGWDMVRGELSLGKEWLDLSGWVEEPVSGKVRIIINDKEVSEPLIGEWYYEPGSQFVRYYARRNPWDDFADTFSFFIAGLKGFVPGTKAEYFQKRMQG
jgi:hypothetical protein